MIFSHFGRRTSDDEDADIIAQEQARIAANSLRPINVPVLVDPSTGVVTAAGAAAGLVNTPDGGIAAGVKTSGGTIVAVPATSSSPPMIVNVDTQRQVVVVGTDSGGNVVVSAGPPVTFNTPTPIPSTGLTNEASGTPSMVISTDPGGSSGPYPSVAPPTSIWPKILAGAGAGLLAGGPVGAALGAGIAAYLGRSIAPKSAVLSGSLGDVFLLSRKARRR